MQQQQGGHLSAGPKGVQVVPALGICSLGSRSGNERLLRKGVVGTGRTGMEKLVELVGNTKGMN